MNKRTLSALAGWLAALAALLPLAALGGPVNINTADASTLARELKGIGLARAQAIVEYRQKNGPFRSADELTQVKGIAARVVEQNRANIRVEKAQSADGADKGRPQAQTSPPGSPAAKSTSKPVKPDAGR